MNRRVLHILVCMAAMSLAAGEAYAQFAPERHLIRKGNRDYEKEDFAESEVDYLRAKEKRPLSFGAKFNLGDAYYRQGRFEEAAAAFSEPAPMGMTPKEAAASLYNAGNSQFQQRKLQEALESYKQSLRLNPDDVEAKFNLAYVKKLLEQDDQQQDDQNDQNQDQQQNQDNQQDQNQDKKQDKKQDKSDQDQNNQDQEDQNNDQNQSDQQNNGDSNDQQQQQQQQPSMSKQDAEQLLEALEASDEKTREKVDGQKGRVLGGSGKNW